MGQKSNPFRAEDITSEDQLNRFLGKCGISSQSPKDVEWLYPWWLREFGPHLPPARYVEVIGDEKFAASLCVAVRQDKFVIYMFNERDYWFDKFGEMKELESGDDLKTYLKQLVDQYLVDWKKWMKRHRPWPKVLSRFPDF